MNWTEIITCSQVSGGVCSYCHRDSYFSTFRRGPEVLCCDCFDEVIRGIKILCGIIVTSFSSGSELAYVDSIYELKAIPPMASGSLTLPFFEKYFKT